MRNRVDKVFNQTLGIPLELPERIRPPTSERPREEKPPVKQHQVDEPIDLSFLEAVRTAPHSHCGDSGDMGDTARHGLYGGLRSATGSVQSEFPTGSLQAVLTWG